MTHLFNGMRPLHHRDGGPVAAALLGSGVACELINDGHHVHDTVARLAVETAGADRIILVTDAMAGAAAGDGRYRSGMRDVTVVNGTARITGTRTLAGSTLTMDRAFRRAVHDLGLGMVDRQPLIVVVPRRFPPISFEYGIRARWPYPRQTTGTAEQPLVGP